MRNLETMKKLETIGTPVCPYCKNNMTIEKCYIENYPPFPIWKCKCSDKVLNKNITKEK